MNKPKNSLSVIYLAGGKFDAEIFQKSLKSSSFADEVVRVKSEEISDFASVRYEAALKAKGYWLLFLDTDEVVTDELRELILQTIKNPEAEAYAIPRRNFIFGKEMKHCGLWPDYVLRLIKKESLIGFAGKLHEQPQVKGKTLHLKEPMIHYKHNNLGDMVDKTNKWSEIEAKLMYDSGHPPMNVLRFFSAAAREFWLRMVKQTAFMDGTEGLIYGIYQVYSRLISYSKLWEIQLKKGEIK